MLTTKLLSWYLGKLEAKQKVKQEANKAIEQKKVIEPKAEQKKQQVVWKTPEDLDALDAAYDANSATSQAYAEPLTASQAKVLRDQFAAAGQIISPWRIIFGQLLSGLVLALLAWLVSGKSNVAWSVAYGAMAVVVPAALFARGLMSRFSSLNAVSAGVGFFVWEFIKIMVTLVLIAIAPKVVVDLDWLAMLIGLIVTMQMVFVLLWILPKLAKKQRQK